MQGKSLIQRIKDKLGPWKAKALLRWREFRFRLNRKQIHGPKELPSCPTDVVLVCPVRNGQAYLESFLEHYRALGVSHMVFLDNGSDDGTVERLCQEDGVTVWTTTVPFGKYKHVMRHFLTAHYGPDNWVLSVDIDEFFDYPYRRDLPLPDLIADLNEQGYTAVVAQMLDMFPKDALRIDEQEWRSSHRYFDISALEAGDYVDYYGNNNRISNLSITYFVGGVRATAFGSRSWMSKHPLTYPSKGALIEYDHHIRNGHVADFSAVLLHYKFVGDFMSYIRTAVVEGSMFNSSVHYRKYLQVLEANPATSLFRETSMELSSIEQLVDCGLLVVSDRFARLGRQQS